MSSEHAERSPWTPRRHRLHLVLACLLVLAPTACKARPASPEVESPGTAEASLAGDAQQVPSAGGSKEAAAALDPGLLPGHLVAVTASPAGVSNRANRFEILDGERETLWVTADGANVTDWTLAPDRSRVAYRIIQRAPGEPAIADEQLVVQALDADSPALIVASADTTLARLAGFAWSPDGSSLAYGKQIGGLPGAGEAAAGLDPVWELRAVAANTESGPTVNDRLLWRAEAEALGPNPLTLVAWDPISGRAAILEQAADSGVAMGIRLIDTRTGALAGEIVTDGKPIGWAETAASPEGRHLLLAEAGESSAHLHLLDLRDGQRRDLARNDQTLATRLRWDSAGRQAAWTRKPLNDADTADPPGPIIVVADMEDETLPRSFEVEGQGAAALAFSPEGRYLLVGETDDPFSLGWSRLAVYEIATGARATLSWTLPEDSWAVFWTE